MDQTSHDLLVANPRTGLVPLSLQEVEGYDGRLPTVRDSRSVAEYCYTCSPILPRFLFDRAPDLELLTYLDADLFFFSDPRVLLDELGSGSIGIIAHRFSPAVADRVRYGR